MGDTHKMAVEAEEFISSKLSKFGILIAKPKFDREGADLLGMLEVGDGVKFIRIQCKGRTLKPNGDPTNIVIPKKYVTQSFLVCLYLVKEGLEPDFAYFFTKKEIEGWNLRDDEYELSIPNLGFEKKFQENILNLHNSTKVKKIILDANSKDIFEYFGINMTDSVILKGASGAVDTPNKKISYKTMNGVSTLVEMDPSTDTTRIVSVSLTGEKGLDGQKLNTSTGVTSSEHGDL